MKFDGESYHHTSASAELAPKLAYEDKQLNMLKIENEATWEGKDDLIALKRSYEDRISSLCYSVENEVSNDVDLMNFHCRDDLRDASTGRIRLIENKTESHADKNVTQIKLPEVVVFDDGFHQIVKDIRVDDGLHSPEKVFLENNDANEDMIASTPSSNDDLSGQMKDGVAPIARDLNFNSLIKDSNNEKSSWGFSEFGESTNAEDEVTDDISDQKVSLEQLLSLEEPDGGSQHVNFTTSNFSAVHKKSNDKKNADEGKNDIISPTETALPFNPIKLNENSKLKDNPKDDTSGSTSLEGLEATKNGISDVKPFNQSSETKEVHTKCEVEGGVTNPEIKSVAVPRDGEESREERDSQQFVQAHCVVEETALDGGTTSPRNSFYQPNHVDLDLFGPSYLSGPKASSGHIAYSGSISLRSDSSTTSTRSFAFPILQSEWNTSPVKMVKAERRYLRRHRRLRMVLFCCKF